MNGTAGPGSIAPAAVAVDPALLAARIALHPLDHTSAGVCLGVRRICLFTNLGANIPAVRARAVSLRFACTDDNLTFAVVLSLRMLATAQPLATLAWSPFQVFIERDYTVMETTNVTLTTPEGDSQLMRTGTMCGRRSVTFGVATTNAGMLGQTSQPDFNPLAYRPNLGQAAGAANQTAKTESIIDPRGASGGHPVVLAHQEGLTVKWGEESVGAPVSGWSLWTEWEWAEVVVF